MTAGRPKEPIGEAKGSGGPADTVAGGAGEDLFDFDVAIGNGSAVNCKRPEGFHVKCRRGYNAASSVSQQKQ